MDLREKMYRLQSQNMATLNNSLLFTTYLKQYSMWCDSNYLQWWIINWIDRREYVKYYRVNNQTIETVSRQYIGLVGRQRGSLIYIISRLSLSLDGKLFATKISAKSC